MTQSPCEWRLFAKSCNAGNSKCATTFLVPVSECVFRKAFEEAASALQVSAWGFRPYSLRRGGATMHWRKNPNMDVIRHMGRWSSERTARLYIQDGLARLAEMHFQVSKPLAVVKAPRFATLGDVDDGDIQVL